MAKVTILKKHITCARKAARASSTARVDGRSVYIKRYPGSNNYKLIMVHVTKKQRALRDMFADANVLAKEDMGKWNRVRHWKRYARKHKKHGAYRAAVSFYYSIIREHGEELKKSEIENTKDGVEMRVFGEDNLFFWVRFDGVEECREALMRLAG